MDSNGKIYGTAIIRSKDSSKSTLTLSTNLELATEIFIFHKPNVKHVSYSPLAEYRGTFPSLITISLHLPVPFFPSLSLLLLYNGIREGREPVPKIVCGLKAWDKFKQELASIPLPRDEVSFEKFFSICMFSPPFLYPHNHS